MLAFLVFGALRTIRTQSIVKGGLFTYALFVLWGILFCIVLPVTVSSIYNSAEVFSLFPSMPGAIAIIVVGWVQGFIFASIVRGIHLLVVKIKAK
ncbi:MAG: hypothetical protein NTY53_21230 [Kiritimatiellaeota bacterium]|nr:hypothetical protein [Kiritimatiellota bacterium]